MKQGHLVVCLIITILFLIPAAQALDLAITQPSVNETSFAEMRDFYVYGIFPTSPLGTPGDVKIELFPASSCTGTVCTGLPLRQIQSHVDPVTGTTNQSCLDFSFVNGVTVKGGYVPDIVINPDGSGYTDPNNKIVVTDRYYAGLVLGGATKTYNTTYKNSSGATLQDLTAGDYTILVTGISRSLNGQVIAKNITFGITNTALGTNRPPDNKNARINYAIQHNLRTYFDSFPGYFSDGGSNWSNFVSRAYPNNGIEVVNDLNGTTLDTIAIANNTMFMYNINAASTTYSVELAPILKYSLQDSANTTFLYFSNGEPFLKYVDTTGTTWNIPSTITPFTGTNRLALTRVEVRSVPPSSYENLYDPNDTAQKTEYTDLSGGITITQGQEFIVFGVTKPIASTVATTSYPYWYSINNRTSQIAYTITNSSGGTVLTASHDVNLSRYFTPGSTYRYNSLFEFGSEFPNLTTPGTYRVSLFGTDVSGTVVAGTSARFNVTVVPVADAVGVFRRGTFYLNGLTPTQFGLPTDTPIVGSWAGTGIDNVGVWRAGTFYLNGGSTTQFGLPTDTPLVWKRGSQSNVGVWRAGTFYFYGGSTTQFGVSTDTPVVGDWAGTGNSNVGVFRQGTFYLKGQTTPIAFGLPTDTPIVWHNSNGVDSVGVWRAGTFYFHGGSTTQFGVSTDTPVVGKWA